MHASPIVDCHTHTQSSPDGASTFEENVRAALGGRLPRARLHPPHHASGQHGSRLRMPVRESELRLHREVFEAARELAAHIAPDLEFVYGFECDWYPGCEPLVDRGSAGAAVRLGSVHWIWYSDVSAAVQQAPLEPRPSRPRGRRLRVRLDRLLREHARLARAGRRRRAGHLRRHLVPRLRRPLAFDVMAHPDLAERFRNEGLAPTSPLEPLGPDGRLRPRHGQAHRRFMPGCARASTSPPRPRAARALRTCRRPHHVRVGRAPRRRHMLGNPRGAAIRPQLRLPHVRHPACRRQLGDDRARLTPRANLSPPDGDPAWRAKGYVPFGHGRSSRR